MIKAIKSSNIVALDSDIEILQYLQNTFFEYEINTFTSFQALNLHLFDYKCHFLFYSINQNEDLEIHINQLNTIKKQVEIEYIVLLIDALDLNRITQIFRIGIYNLLVKTNDLLYIDQYFLILKHYNIVVSPSILKEVIWKNNFPNTKTYNGRLKVFPINDIGRKVICLIAKNLTVEEISIALDIPIMEVNKVYYDILRHFNISYRFIKQMIVSNEVYKAYNYLYNLY